MSEDRRETVEAPDNMRGALGAIFWIAENGRGDNDWKYVAQICRAALEGQQSPEPRHIRRLGDPDADAAVVAKRAGQSQSERAEPVAWLYESEGFSDAVSKRRLPLDKLLGNPKETPLYASPQSSIGAGEQKEKTRE